MKKIFDSICYQAVRCQSGKKNFGRDPDPGLISNEQTVRSLPRSAHQSQSITKIVPTMISIFYSLITLLKINKFKPLSAFDLSVYVYIRFNLNLRQFFFVVLSQIFQIRVDESDCQILVLKLLKSSVFQSIDLQYTVLILQAYLIIANFFSYIWPYLGYINHFIWSNPNSVNSINELAFLKLIKQCIVHILQLPRVYFSNLKIIPVERINFKVSSITLEFLLSVLLFKRVDSIDANRFELNLFLFFNFTCCFGQSIFLDLINFLPQTSIFFRFLDFLLNLQPALVSLSKKLVLLSIFALFFDFVNFI